MWFGYGFTQKLYRNIYISLSPFHPYLLLKREPVKKKIIEGNKLKWPSKPSVHKNHLESLLKIQPLARPEPPVILVERFWIKSLGCDWWTICLCNVRDPQANFEIRVYKKRFLSEPIPTSLLDPTVHKT